MNKKAFVITAVAAFLAVVVAFVSLDQGPAREGQGGGLAVPGLLDAANRIEAVVLRTADETMTIENREGSWVMAERGGWPVRGDRVRSLILGLGGLEKLEPKTRNKARYAEIGVEGPDASPHSRSVELTFFDADGGTVAALILGHLRGDVGGGSPGVYLRGIEDEQAWLARGRLDFALFASEWLDRDLLDVSQSRIKRVTVTQPDAKTWTAARNSPEERHLAIAGVTLNHETALDGLAGALEHLSLDDVRPAENVSVADQYIQKLEFETFDGLLIRARIASVMGEYWMWLEAEGGPDGEGTELQSRLSPWVFQVATFKGARMMKRLEEIIAAE